MGPTLIRPAAARRRISVGACLAALAVVTLVSPAFAQQAAPAARTFTADAGMIFNIIKPDKTADFEMVMGRLKEALQKSADPQRKEMAAGWKLFKSQEPGPNGNVLYIFIMDPVVKGADYTTSKILAEAFPDEVQALYQKFSDSYAAGQNLVNLALISAFGDAAGAAPAAAPAAPPQ